MKLELEFQLKLAGARADSRAGAKARARARAELEVELVLRLKLEFDLQLELELELELEPLPERKSLFGRHPAAPLFFKMKNTFSFFFNSRAFSSACRSDVFLVVGRCFRGRNGNFSNFEISENCDF